MFEGDADNRNILDDINDSEVHLIESLDNDYFKQFEWLKPSSEESLLEHDIDNAFLKMRSSLLSMCTGGTSMDIEPDKKQDACENKLYMYFISLDQDKMFLYTDFKDTDESILEKSQEHHDYMKMYQPRKIVFTMEITDFYDVDKYVKQFMHMFGIDNTRGGSYCDIVLDEDSVKCIEREREITCLEYYTEHI
jgi:hypothetical protein